MDVIRIKRMSKVYNVVMYIVIANIIAFIFQQLSPGFQEIMLLDSKLVFEEPWRLITHLFVHGSFFHIFFNMYVLFMFGTLVENRIGSKRFLFVYFLSGILAGLAFSLIHPASMGLGASGAIMAVLGIVIIQFPHLKVLFFLVIPMSIRTAGIIIAMIDIFGLISPTQTGIAHISHLVGLACGLAYAYFLPKINIKKKRKDIIDIDLTRPQEEIDEYFKN